MRKSISPISPICLIGLICLISLTACSSGGDVAGDEPSPTPVNPPIPEPQTETAITFKSSLAGDEEVTRATGLETEVTTFKVWAYKNMSVDVGTTPTDPSDDSYGDLQTVMPAYNVVWGANTANTTTSNTNDWEYVGKGTDPNNDQTIKYWDWSAKAYRFFGITDANSSIVSISGTPNNSFTFTVDASNDAAIAATPYFSKLWFSTGMVVNYPDKLFGHPVVLEFMKPIARVRFIFTFAEGLDFGRSALTNMHFKPTDEHQAIPNKGTVTITYPLTGTETKESWTSEATAWFGSFNIDYYEADDTYTPTDTAPEVYDNTPEKWYYVLPIANQGTYTMSVRVNGGEPQTAVVPAEFMNWAPGYQYTYRFKIKESGGVILDEIQVGINRWTVKGTSDHPVYNW